MLDLFAALATFSQGLFICWDAWDGLDAWEGEQEATTT